MNENAIILHLESATKVCSVALTRGKELIAVKETEEGNKHSEWMTSFISEILTTNSLEAKDLDAIAVSQGPGSYTGLRVSYSVAKGMAYSLQIPMIGIDTLLSLRNAYHLSERRETPQSSEITLPMIDARRMEVYTSAIDSKGKIVTDLHAHILNDDTFNFYNRYDRIILVGDGAFKIRELNLPDPISKKIQIYDNIICSAAHLRYEAWSKFNQSDFLDVAYCVPQYLKSPNITTPKKKILGN